jgi:uncharacterized protein YabE (DUF348 family)
VSAGLAEVLERFNVLVWAAYELAVRRDTNASVWLRVVVWRAHVVGAWDWWDHLLRVVQIAGAASTLGVAGSFLGHRLATDVHDRLLVF